MTFGSTIIGAVVGVALVAAVALIVYGIRGRGPKKAPRRRIPQKHPRRDGDNPFQDAINRGRRDS